MGGMIGNAMSVNVLERLLPRVLFSLGKVDKARFEFRYACVSVTDCFILRCACCCISLHGCPVIFVPG